MTKGKRLNPLLWMIMIFGAVPVIVLSSWIFLSDFQGGDREEPPFPSDTGRETGIRPEIVADIDTPMEREEPVAERNPPAQMETMPGPYQGIKARVIDGYTQEAVPRFTFWICEASQGMIENNMQPNKAKPFLGNESGMLSVYDLEDGDYSVAIQARGYSTFIKRGLRVPQEKEFLVFELSRGNFIAGRVLDAGGRPVRGMLVHLGVERLFNPKDLPPATRISKSDDKGAYLFGDLPPGTYSLYLSSLQSPLAKANDITVGAGGSYHQDLILPALLNVKFHVTDPFGHSIPNARIKFYERNKGTPSFNPVTDFYGKAECNYVPPGDYHLRITKNSYKPLVEENFKVLPGPDEISVTRVLEMSRNE